MRLELCRSNVYPSLFSYMLQNLSILDMRSMDDALITFLRESSVDQLLERVVKRET